VNVSVVGPVVGPAVGSSDTFAWYVPVPGEVNVPIGVIVVDTWAGMAPGLTGMLTGGDVDGLDCPCVVADDAGDTDAGEPPGTFTAMVTGGKLPPGCTVAFVVHVTC
jgi:hypothetical protein